VAVVEEVVMAKMTRCEKQCRKTCKPKKKQKVVTGSFRIGTKKPAAKGPKKTLYCLQTGMFRANPGLRCFTTEAARAKASRRGVFGHSINMIVSKGTKASDLFVKSRGR
jgi:hypothetical protein